MQVRTLVKGLWLALLSMAVAARAYGIQATLVADAHVNSARPSVNSGGISNVNVGNGYTGLLQFDLGVLPTATTPSQVSRAILRVYVNQLDTAGLVSLQPITGAWSEYGVTFQTLPGVAAAAQVFSVSQAGAYVAVDVTALVQGWIAAPATNFGVALTAGTASLAIDSKENDLTGHGAELDIQIVSQGPQGAAGPTGPAGPQGVAGTAGVAGAAGATGPQGVAGPQGASGPPGASGPQGTQGLPGIGFEGAYASATSYGLNDVVAFGGSSWISLVAANHGNTPGLSPADWTVLAAMGSTGATGPQGLPGAAGAAGIQGPQGATGAQGPAGKDGAAGAPGLVYQGAYASTANYALGDVVLWQGSSWASLTAANHGNTPSLSPASWGLLTAQGPAGAAGATGPQGPQGVAGALGPTGPPGEKGDQGAQGIAGQAGAQGLTGSKGDTGLSGPMGPQGVAGPVGLSFQGTYQSAANYALADGVMYNGAGYVSLIAANHGNTPDQSPAAWALFAAAGSPGASGPAGPAGATGPQGVAGPQGATGAAGAQGPQGVQGPPVANYLGNYASTANYAYSDAVSFQGSTYISLAAGNHGNAPGLSPAFWAVLAAQGPAGATGPQGAQGIAGAAGAAGAQGAAGPQGPPVAFAGGWLIGTSYAVGDAVSYAGGSYIALLANTGREPDLSPIYWGVLAQAGAAGPAGPAGATGQEGPTGYPGPQGPVGATGAAGPQGSAGPAGAAGPAGPQGVAGPTGPTGLPGLNWRGTYSSVVNYASNDGVQFQGSSYISLTPSNAGNTPDLSPSNWSLLASIGVQGAAGQSGASGAAGPTGPSGTAATVQVGSVTTGAPGSSASVVNVGTATAAVLNFNIPQGQQGSAGTGSGGGAAGSAGSSGVPFASMYHAVSYASQFYSVNNTNQSATEGVAVLTWVPQGCSATALTVYSLQAVTITVTLRAGTPGTLADTALTCSVSQGQSCTATGAVTIPAGGFIDLSIAHPDSNPSGVWAALTCN